MKPWPSERKVKKHYISADGKIAALCGMFLAPAYVSDPYLVTCKRCKALIEEIEALALEAIRG